MGELLTFLHRARDAGGWTPAERARLEALADSYAGGGGGHGLEVVFGASDAGDPWCAVKDSEDEVVVHVARIGDRVVAHFPLDETLAEGPDLYSTLREWLRGHEDGVVVAFNPHGREGQSLLALLLAAALLEEELGAPRQWLAPAAGGAPLLETSPDSRGATPEPPPEASAQSGYSPPDAPAAEADFAATAAPTVRLDPAPAAATSTVITSDAPVETSTPAASSPSASLELARVGHASQAPGGTQQVIRGASGDDLLSGGPGAEKLLGGEGADTLRGGGGGDTLDGGRGDDRIELAGDSLAIGGEGADTFVVQAPTVQTAGDKPLLGVVVDFRPEEGDRLVTSEGVVITGPSIPPSLTSLQTAAPAGDLGRVAVDFDQDGVAEGFVVLRAEHARGQGAPGAEELIRAPERFSEGWIGF